MKPISPGHFAIALMRFAGLTRLPRFMLKSPLDRSCGVPAAGLEARFLPASQEIPKEMAPAGDEPTLHCSPEAPARR